MGLDTDELRARAVEAVNSAVSPSELETVRIAYLGRKGEITGLLRSLANLAPDQRRSAGAALNKLKNVVQAAIETRKEDLLNRSAGLDSALDVTMPGIDPGLGGLHPTVQMMYDLNDAFESLNFDIYDGPEVTSELYEFDSMNFPPDHPARESMDTYWLSGFEEKHGAKRLCLRPHLTGASVRYMQEHEPPFRFVYPGRVYRNESTDSRHERAFFQYEALLVDRDVPFSAGKLMINTILNTVFGYPVKTRMRSGFFPFVEPGFEIDMECQVCSGGGCQLCKGVGWLEVMPGGVPHPNVLRAAGIDPDRWMGFYINIGLDRLVMMRYGIEDVRLFHSADLRFLTQFN